MELSHIRNNGKIQDYKLITLLQEKTEKGSNPTSSLSSTSIPPSCHHPFVYVLFEELLDSNLSSVKHGGLSDRHGSEIKQRAITNLPPKTQAIVKRVEFQTKPNKLTKSN